MNQLLDKNKYTKDSEPSPFSELNGPFYTQVVNNKIYKGFEVATKNYVVVLQNQAIDKCRKSGVPISKGPLSLSMPFNN